MSLEVSIVEVVGVTSRERSSVVGGGGGGETYRGIGYTLPIWIRTVNQTLTEVWVRFADEREDHFDFTNIRLPVRQGHFLAILTYNNMIWAVRNFTTESTHWLVTASQLAGPRYSPGFWGLFGYFFLIYIWSAVIIALLGPTNKYSGADGMWLGMACGVVGAPILATIVGLIKNQRRSTVVNSYERLLTQGQRLLAEAGYETDESVPPPFP